MVTCKYCGKKIDKTTAYSTTTKVPKYYCNEEEYLKEKQEKEDNKKVVCKICKRKILKKDAFHMIHTTPSGNIVNWYFCNEQEYVDKINEKLDADKCKNKLVEFMGFTLAEFEPSWSQFMKEIRDITNKYSWRYIYDYLVSDERDILNAMSKKFNTDFQQRRYFEAVIRSDGKADRAEERRQVDGSIDPHQQPAEPMGVLGTHDPQEQQQDQRADRIARDRGQRSGENPGSLHQMVLQQVLRHKAEEQRRNEEHIASVFPLEIVVCQHRKAHAEELQTQGHQQKDDEFRFHRGVFLSAVSVDFCPLYHYSPGKGRKTCRDRVTLV